MFQEPEMTVLLSHLVWKKKNKIALFGDEQQTLDEYANKLLLVFIYNAESFSGDVTRHREMEKVLLNIYGRLEFWEKRTALTNALKIVGALEQDKPVW